MENKNDEIQDVQLEDQAEQVEEVESTEEESTELTPEQKKGAAKRKLSKILKEFPDLIEDKEEEVEDKAEVTESATQTQPLTREEAALLAQGESLEGVDTLNKIAQRDGITIMQARDSEEFTIWKEAQDRKAKQKASQLEATQGGGTRKRKDFKTSGLSEEEHKEMFKRKMGL